MARRSGCTRQTINAIEAAKYGPSLELAFKIAEVFDEGIEAVFEAIEFPIAMLAGAAIYEQKEKSDQPAV